MPQYRNASGGHICYVCYAAGVHGDVSDWSERPPTDSPIHCTICGRLCDYSLTWAGIRYVIGRLLSAMNLGGGYETGWEYNLAYYASAGPFAPLRDEARALYQRQVLGYGDVVIVEAFLTYVTANGNRARPEPHNCMPDSRPEIFSPREPIEPRTTARRKLIRANSLAEEPLVK